MNRTDIEIEAKALFDKKFGISPVTRFAKVREEFTELQQAIEEGNPEHIKDEISDLYATVSHLATIYGLHHTDLLMMAIDKVKGRENDPNYKRYREKEEIINIKSHTLKNLQEINPISKSKKLICKLLNITPIRKWQYRYLVETNFPLIYGRVYIDELFQQWKVIAENEIVNLGPIHELYLTTQLRITDLYEVDELMVVIDIVRHREVDANSHRF